MPPAPREQDIEWLGHAGFRLKVSGKTIYIDPYRAPRGAQLVADAAVRPLQARQ